MPVYKTRVLFSVHPRAPRNEITSFKGGAWQVKIKAPPVEGKGNIELIAFLSEKLGVARHCIAIVSGHTGRRKIISVEGLTADEIAQRLLPRPLSPG